MSFFHTGHVIFQEASTRLWATFNQICEYALFQWGWSRGPDGNFCASPQSHLECDAVVCSGRRPHGQVPGDRAVGSDPADRRHVPRRVHGGDPEGVPRRSGCVVPPRGPETTAVRCASPHGLSQGLHSGRGQHGPKPADAHA